MNWGIIGMGRIARKFADDLKLIPGAKLHAVASTSPDRATAFAREYGVEHAYGRYEDLLACEGLDVVYVATPHVYHCENALMCLENGLPVLCEKPFSMNTAETRRMIEAAHRNRVFLMEALWSLFIPGVQKAFDLLEQGVIGDLHTIRANLGFHMPPDDLDGRVYNKALGAGSLLDLGGYPAMLSLALFGKPERSDIMAMGTFTQTDVDESCSFMFRYPGNRMMMGYSSIAANTSLAAGLYGSKGHILLNPRWHHPTSLTLSLYEGRHERLEHIETPYTGHGYHYEAAHVMDCLERGLTESPVVPLDLSLGLTGALDAIREEIGLEY
jgi:predicted dehydrogenase